MPELYLNEELVIMVEPLSKDTFETFTREHQKYLDSNFNKLAGCINNVQKSVDEIKVAREKVWETHAQESATSKKGQEVKFRKVYKYILIGCAAAALLGGVLAPVIGIDVIVGVAKAFFTFGSV
jgi:hypothetical protein